MLAHCSENGVEIAYSCRCKYIISEDNTLRFNNEEVNELMKIPSKSIKSLLWESVVFSWADLGDETVVEKSLARCLSQNSD